VKLQGGRHEGESVDATAVPVANRFPGFTISQAISKMRVNSRVVNLMVCAAVAQMGGEHMEQFQDMCVHMSCHQGASAAEKYARDVLSHEQGFFMIDTERRHWACSRHCGRTLHVGAGPRNVNQPLGDEPNRESTPGRICRVLGTNHGRHEAHSLCAKVRRATCAADNQAGRSERHVPGIGYAHACQTPVLDMTSLGQKGEGF
jgi:hypothetical protein